MGGRKRKRKGNGKEDVGERFKKKKGIGKGQEESLPPQEMLKGQGVARGRKRGGKRMWDLW